MAGDMPPAGVPSREVTWAPVHEFVSALVLQAQCGDPRRLLELAGTPAWVDLPDNDPRKTLALLVAGEHWCLRTELVQLDLADSSRAISRALDWAKYSRQLQQRNEFYNARPWLRRATA